MRTWDNRNKNTSSRIDTLGKKYKIQIDISVLLRRLYGKKRNHA